ncbi:hypothetical protein PC9H_009828 [Pleurotus ostreatus]|uniref:DNA2/NAM7 helicase-like C-terminal domain-containing protein n=1 Tax=Pleurotus ostreatus TaxID=5322 RepID=A0A8H6ZS17_PLEOS|nr:uncharacterized protein PC9H_009828 [Pleurotus ostreatus]KAF7424521.1 hypothetical protein PC9H_009828 [Pleurotus ostreatus]
MPRIQHLSAPAIYKSLAAPTIQVVDIHISELRLDTVTKFLQSCADDVPLGISPEYGAHAALAAVAFSSPTHAIYLRLSSKRSNRPCSPNRLLLQPLLASTSKKYALQMDVLATALYLDLDLRINHGIDMLSAAKGNRYSRQAVYDVLGGDSNILADKVDALFFNQELSNRQPILRAWALCKAASSEHVLSRLRHTSEIDTSQISTKRLSVLAKLVRDAELLNRLKPTVVKNSVDPNVTKNKSGEVILHSTRYKTRLMPNGNPLRVVTINQKGKQQVNTARLKRVKGRAATIDPKTPLQGNKVVSVSTLGREPPTNAERVRFEVVLSALQRTSRVLDQSFVQRLWLPSEASATPTVASNFPTDTPIYSPKQALNDSQRKAVSAILAADDYKSNLTLIHGPPGTGKTTVIASAVTSIGRLYPFRPMWLVAQSNVAVKNIAEKLASVGFTKFKILVSEGFHFDWHEHLYEKIAPNVIRSDAFTKSSLEASRQLLDSNVLLCTLSMFANDSMKVYTRCVAVETVIFDEASQIEVGCYLPLFARFNSTLRKLVFIGDDKQLPPHGQGDIEDLQSIFEMEHLRNHDRMPVVIGNFISTNVYGSRLRTVHQVRWQQSCLFVDVSNGKEAQQGTSWTNIPEIRAVIKIAQRFHKQGKPYRIITPYDAQRSKIEGMLKQEKLPWEDKCFNVDSFQGEGVAPHFHSEGVVLKSLHGMLGNEEDHIIISVVRTQKIGFLQEARRVNVMLTRCKKSMVLCTNKAFIQGPAATSLVGRLAAQLGPKNWVGLG